MAKAAASATPVPPLYGRIREILEYPRLLPEQISDVVGRKSSRVEELEDELRRELRFLAPGTDASKASPGTRKRTSTKKGAGE